MTLIVVLFAMLGVFALHIASAISAGRLPNTLDWVGGLFLVAAFWLATPLLKMLP